MSQNTSPLGLTQNEADLRLRQFGHNTIEQQKWATWLENLRHIISDPMGIMLFCLSLVYWLIGDVNEAILLLAALVPIIGVDVVLQMRSQKALRALKKSLPSTCFVMRDGKTVRISVHHIVPGDALILEEGQTLAADGVLIESVDLTIDESSLTGESIPVEKKISDEVLSGTTVLTGRGIVEVQKTGLSSQMGAIAKVLQEFESESSPLLKLINKWVRIFFILAVAFAAIIFLLSWFKGHGFGLSLITSLTVAMAAIPEEFPLIFTLYLSLAAYRLSQRGILVKTLPAVEGLGRVDVICTDKTGTLTEGKFRLENIDTIDSEASDESLIRAMILSCEPKAIDAMENAIFESVEARFGSQKITEAHSQWRLEHDYPFDVRDKYMCHIWRNNQTGQQFLAMKGSVEGVLARCRSETNKSKILALTEKYSSQGQRLLALAASAGSFSGERARDEKDLNFMGLLCFSDPIRPSVPAAIKECVRRGIQIKMLTGDHLLTAHAISDAIGLPHTHDQIFSGVDLDRFSSTEKARAYISGAIFARLKPEQKLELVKCLKASHKIVAMTGDGVNDAPALKLADIGISMGDRATDVARSSAQMVLIKNDFGGIVDAIIQGKNVLSSLSESFGYLVAFHIPIILLALAQALILDSQILMPIHIVLLELIVHPVSAFVFAEVPVNEDETVDARSMKSRLIGSAFRGLLVTALAWGVFHYFDGSFEQQRTAALFFIVFANMGLLIAESGGLIGSLMSRPKRVLIASGLLLALGFALNAVPAFVSLFSLEPISWIVWLILAAVGILLGATVWPRQNSSPPQ